MAVMGNKIPLYGSGASLSNSTGMPTVPVPLKLSFDIRSRAYVLGRLVKPKYYQEDCMFHHFGSQEDQCPSFPRVLAQLID